MLNKNFAKHIYAATITVENFAIDNIVATMTVEDFAMDNKSFAMDAVNLSKCIVISRLCGIPAVMAVIAKVLA